LQALADVRLSTYQTPPLLGKRSVPPARPAGYALHRNSTPSPPSIPLPISCWLLPTPSRKLLGSAPVAVPRAGALAGLPGLPEVNPCPTPPPTGTCCSASWPCRWTSCPATTPSRP
jgi:hypothetical protein